MMLMTVPVMGVPVSIEQVRSAAGGFAARGRTMGRRLGARVLGVDTFSVTNGYAFHAVRLEGESTLFMSSDTELEPVIAFAAGTNLDLSAASPLRKLLDRDIRLRSRMRAQRTGAAKWRSLDASPASASADPQEFIDDVRVAPLLKTTWSQQNDNSGRRLYNYHTPNHWPCGCSATAAGQVMNYFRYPTQEVASVTNECIVGKATNLLSTIAGVYDWSLMNSTGDVNVESTEEQREMVGRFLYDVGVVLKSDYQSSGTAAYLVDYVRVFRTPSFGYANGYLFYTEPTGYGEGAGGLHNESIRQRVLYANLDAKRPVLLGIFGDTDYHNGHAVVGDGYGYKSIGGVSTSFVHINLGWAGADDCWYNLPEIDAATVGALSGQGGVDFRVMVCAAFNISPDETGEILSGRAHDHFGSAVSNVLVRAYEGVTLRGETVTDENGVYAFTLPGSKTYRIAFLTNEVEAAEIPVVWLGRTHSNNPFGNEYSDCYIIDSIFNVGNRWGNDVELYNGEPRYTLTIAAEDGSGEAWLSPEIGSTLVFSGEVVTVSADYAYVSNDQDGPIVSYPVLGFSGSGSVPAFVATNVFSFVITNDTVITWRWNGEEPEFRFRIWARLFGFCDQTYNKWSRQYSMARDGAGNYLDRYFNYPYCQVDVWVKTNTEFNVRLPEDAEIPAVISLEGYHQGDGWRTYCFSNDWWQTCDQGSWNYRFALTTYQSLLDGYGQFLYEADGAACTNVMIVMDEPCQLVLDFFEENESLRDFDWYWEGCPVPEWCPTWWGLKYMWWRSDEPDFDSSAAGDPDGDGFSNAREFRWQTSPLDPLSRPPGTHLLLW